MGIKTIMQAKKVLVVMAQKLQIDTAHAGNDLIVSTARLVAVRLCAVRQERALRLHINLAEEVMVHEIEGSLLRPDHPSGAGLHPPAAQRRDDRSGRGCIVRDIIRKGKSSYDH